MLFEQHQLQTPTINDGGLSGCSTANPLLSSLDFFLLDDVESYIPSVHSKKTKKEYVLSNNSPNSIDDNTHDDSNNSNEQQHHEFFSDFDLFNLADFDEKSELIDNSLTIDDLELEKYISLSAFPSPPIDVGQDPTIMPHTEDSASSSSVITWIGEECTVESSTVDMADLLSPPLSSASSSPATRTRKSCKKTGLSTVDRKLRKKDQNKTAAEKYRIKKKGEKSHVFDRHAKLKLTNRDLKIEMENLNFRVQQLKQLFVDLLQVQLPSTIESS